VSRSIGVEVEGEILEEERGTLVCSWSLILIL
jgi:hypothetical protein